jgi:predicted DNA-binding protein
MERKVSKGKARDKHSVMIRLDAELYQALKAEAKRLHLPLATVVKLWIVERLELRGAKQNA